MVPFTLAAAALTFFGVIYLLGYVQKVHLLRALLIAMGATIAGGGLFELVYQQVGYAAILNGYLPGLSRVYSVGAPIGLFGWVVLGLSGIGYSRWTWRCWVLLAAFLALFVGWFLVGYPQIWPGYSMEQFQVTMIFNVPTKFLAFLVFLVPILEDVWSRGFRLFPGRVGKRVHGAKSLTVRLFMHQSRQRDLKETIPTPTE